LLYTYIQFFFKYSAISILANKVAANSSILGKRVIIQDAGQKLDLQLNSAKHIWMQFAMHIANDI
jgi:hypothetical protein